MTQLLWKSLFVAATVVLLFTLTVVGWFAIYISGTPNLAPLADFTPNSPTTINPDTIGACLSSPFTAIPYSQISLLLRQAVNSTEGASTFSRQIARGLFCNSHDQVLQREIKEMRVTMELELRFSREQLFTIYMNRVYFGESIVGIQNAAQHYFSKDATALTLPQAALLAGMIRSPGFYSPDTHPDRVLQRRNAILDAMLLQGYIDAATAERAKAAPLR
ncbi:MAG TPA: biosynthetic peptidoglycan transglycosylase [Terriglobales bacterium]|jgi:membrane peptidoglycan carboxypeptidase|nr:biosynthetic peptidoglycan transglycosylase [Terriglobales bacterium]